MIERPILRYHGGKYRLAPWIVRHFPAHRIYTEAFGGAASVLMRKSRSHAEVYNDLDGEIVNVMRVLREQPRDLARVCALTPFARVEFDRSYAADADPVEQARRTLLRSFAGFGSSMTRPNRDGSPQRTGFRANATRSGTVPAMDWATLPANFEAFAARLAGVVIESRDATQVIATHDGPDTLHYVDPPYPHSTRTRGADAGHSGYRHEMTDADHRRLAGMLRGLRGMVVLSGYPCDMYDRDLYADWWRVEREARADGARARVEVLWINPACADQLNREAVSCMALL